MADAGINRSVPMTELIEFHRAAEAEKIEQLALLGEKRSGQAGYHEWLERRAALVRARDCYRLTHELLVRLAEQLHGQVHAGGSARPN